MAKNSVIISVSIDKSQAEFLDSTQLSPSELLQSAIATQKRLYEDYNSKNMELSARIEAYIKEVKLLNAYIDQLGKFTEFQRWKHVVSEENKQAEQ